MIARVPTLTEASFSFFFLNFLENSKVSVLTANFPDSDTVPAGDDTLIL